MSLKTEPLPNLVNFHDDEMHHVCFAGFEQMRRRGKLCDVTLISQGKRFAAHKLVLAATIPFFNGMFLSNMSECNKDEISIFGLDACALEAFIGFAYTGSVQITPYNVQSLLIGASFLHISSIRNICCKYIEERLSPSTVLTVRDFAQSFMCGKLTAACDYYILEHFDAVSQTSAFLKASAADLMNWLESDELCVSNEEKLFQVIMDWIEYETCPTTPKDHTEPESLFDLGKAPSLDQSSTLLDLVPSSEPNYVPRSPSAADNPLSAPSKESYSGAQSRAQLLPDLLRRIRLPLISANFISSVISKHPLVRENITCRDLLDEVRDMLLLRDPRAISSFCCRPRRGQDTLGIIYAVGGLTANGDCHGIVETYHPSLGRWELAENMPSQRSRIGVISLNGCLYAIGGFDGTARLNTTEMYDPKTKTWHTLAPMNRKRSALGAAVMNGLIYVCGGYDGVSSLRASEVYDPKQDKWFIIPSMIEPRSAGGLVALDNGCLYAVGGHNGLAIYSSVECYCNPTAGAATSAAPRIVTGDQSNAPSTPSPWHQVARMIHRRCRHGVTALRNRIIVAGGYNGVSFMRSVEMFDPAAGPDANGLMGQWTEIAPLGIPRSRVGLAVTGGRLYAIGGYDGTSHLRTVECFQPNTSFIADTPSLSSRLSSTVDITSEQQQSYPPRRSIPARTTEHVIDLPGSGSSEEDELSSLSTASVSETALRSLGSQSFSQIESRAARNGDSSNYTYSQPASSAMFSNWTWSTAAPLIAHEGWVGVGVLPITDPTVRGGDENAGAKV